MDLNSLLTSSCTTLRVSHLQRIQQPQKLAPEGVAQHWSTLGVDKDQQGLGAGGHFCDAVVLPLQL